MYFDKNYQTGPTTAKYCLLKLQKLNYFSLCGSLACEKPINYNDGCAIKNSITVIAVAAQLCVSKAFKMVLLNFMVWSQAFRGSCSYGGNFQKTSIRV